MIAWGLLGNGVGWAASDSRPCQPADMKGTWMSIGVQTVVPGFETGPDYFRYQAYRFLDKPGQGYVKLTSQTPIQSPNWAEATHWTYTLKQGDLVAQNRRAVIVCERENHLGRPVMVRKLEQMTVTFPYRCRIQTTSKTLPSGLKLSPGNPILEAVDNQNKPLQVHYFKVLSGDSP